MSRAPTTPLPPASPVEAEERAGTASHPPATDRGFLSIKKGLTLIDFPGAAETNPRELSPNGTVTGDYINCCETPGSRHGFIWRGGKFITSFDVPGALETIVSGINAQGPIVGSYRVTVPGVQRGYLRSP